MDRSKECAESWHRNAANWTRAVRGGSIPSRSAGTDEAIVRAVLRRAPRRLLDLGCGEGWLARHIAQATGCAAVGIDASAPLIEAAREADPANRYEVLSYRDLVAGTDRLGAGFDVIACNYALFEENVADLLAALRGRLSERGVIVIQTLHPQSVESEQNRRDGWRIEDFAAFEGQDWAPMPWFFRTLDSWRQAVRDAGLVVLALEEPAAGPGQPALSLLLVCAPSPI